MEFTIHLSGGVAGEDVLEFSSHVRILPTTAVRIGVVSSRDMSHPFFSEDSTETTNWIRQSTDATIAVATGPVPNLEAWWDVQWTVRGLQKLLFVNLTLFWKSSRDRKFNNLEMHTKYFNLKLLVFLGLVILAKLWGENSVDKPPNCPVLLRLSGS